MAKAITIGFRVSELKKAAIDAKLASYNASKKELNPFSDPSNLSEIMIKLVDEWLTDKIKL